MPIVAQYLDPTYKAVLAFLNSQRAAQQQAQQPPGSDPLTQYLLGGGGGGGIIQQPTGLPGTGSRINLNPSAVTQGGAGDQRSRDARAAAFYAADARGGGGGHRGNSDYAVASIINNLINGGQQLQMQDAITNRQMAYGQQQAGYAMDRAGMDSELAIFQDLMTRELPEDLVAGLQSQNYIYTREQEREMEDLRDGISKVDRSGSFTPEEKAAIKREQAERLWEIRSQPQRNPNPPVPLDQQFEQETVVRDGVRWTRGRQGEWTPREVESPEMEMQKQQAEIDNKRYDAEWNVEFKTWDAEVNTWLKMQPKIEHYRSTDPMTGEAINNDAGYQQDMAAWRAQRPVSPAWTGAGGGMRPPQPTPPSAGGPQPGAQPQQQPPSIEEAAQAAATVPPGMIAKLSTGEYPIVKGDGDEAQYVGQIVITTAGRIAVVE